MILACVVARLLLRAQSLIQLLNCSWNFARRSFQHACP